MTTEQIQTGGSSSASSIPAILVVTRNGKLSEPVMEYGVNVAARLGCRLLIVFVNTLPLLLDSVEKQQQFSASIEQSVARIRAKAKPRNIHVDYVQDTGRINKVINNLCHIVKRVEFVVIDKGINLENALSGSPVPVFNVLSVNRAGAGYKTGSHLKTGKNSQDGEKRSRMCAWLQTAFFGALTIAAYGAIIKYPEAISTFWNKGRLHSFLLIGSACLFFIIQIRFAKSLSSLLRSGIQDAPDQSEPKKESRISSNKGTMKQRSTTAR
ncbi:universal stress protein [Desulforhopalus singaporensis]|uniref:Universal stress protein family protein n=1 Tax=Desulforhopalus singaporensis TaxID=91360 RepID=A0A1H0L7G9_9BACT|nr:universal stress protein [Desulforhopalus singaporensis]SDO64167.1 hypothetical protein SAMN05660330_00695 [Desulforhopalus singaporensis]